MPAYATVDQLRDWLGDQPIPSEAPRLILRASEKIDDLITNSYAVDDDELPTDPIVAKALEEATCACIEYWQVLGEGIDIVASTGSVSFAGLSMERAPDRIPPRSDAILRRAGLRGEPLAPGHRSSERYFSP